MFSSYLSQQQYHPKWKQVIVKNTREKFGWPAKRGGHQLCADYLHSKFNDANYLMLIVRQSCSLSELFIL